MHVFDADTPAADIERAIAAGEHFWLDLPSSAFDTTGPVARALGVDPVTLRRLNDHGGRPRAFVADRRAAIVFAGMSLSGNGLTRVDVTILAGDAGVVTLRDGPCIPLEELRSSPHDVDVLSILDALTDSLLGVANQMDDRVDRIEDEILQPGAGRMLPQVTAMRQEVSDLLRVTRSQHGLVVRNEAALGQTQVAYGDGPRRVRDLEGHLAFADSLAGSTRDTIAETLDLYLSITAERLTRIATVLLPLTVVTGFFGMNFQWMVDHIDTFWSFLVFGVGGPLVAVAGVRLYLRRRGYG